MSPKVESAEKARSKSLKFRQSVGVSSAPRLVRPMKRAIEVLTPVIVLTPLGISSM
jgi:hypothetical protein